MLARPPRSPHAAVTLLRALPIALIFVLGVPTVSPAVAAASEGDVTWGVRTATSGTDPERQNFGYTLDPGESLSDALIISNHDEEPLELDVYAADGFTTTSGQVDLVTRDTASVAAGSWTALDTGQVSIPAGESVEVPFTVTIPAEATPGDYLGGILTSLPQPGQEQGIDVDRRLGIRMHVRVLGDLQPGLSVENLSVSYAGTANPFGTGDATVSYSVVNTGNVRVAAGQTVGLAGPWGMLPTDIANVAAVPELLPGESWPVTVSVAAISPVFWLTASVFLDPELAVVAGSTPGITPVEASAGTWALPWAQLVLLVLLAAGVVATMLVRKRRRTRRALREDARVQQAVDEALRSVDAEAVPTH
ncbi:DUF916 domain-containing protein [Cryobacterium melibiosiphilum]|uniref:DUF916 domain-containing protein n=1 Tax=Cryobacterium melibiosiphilum TaxID=995039 RepID=A0A3A5MUX4_9MICO|nr:DUF916 domain-containing protein [Cryobacterium melibiosiphilum]RJT91043.1 DUF916 domain-containing protein [Cryobacterium melibiosiphilum]